MGEMEEEAGDWGGAFTKAGSDGMLQWESDDCQSGDGVSDDDDEYGDDLHLVVTRDCADTF